MSEMSMYNPIMDQKSQFFIIRAKKDLFKLNKIYTNFFFGLYKKIKFLYQIEVLYKQKTIYMSSFASYNTQKKLYELLCVLYKPKKFLYIQKKTYMRERRSNRHFVYLHKTN